MNKKIFQRVDFQVTLLIVVIVALSSYIIYNLIYKLSYREMINLLSSNSNSIAEHIELEIDTDIFSEITTKADMSNESYIEAQSLLDTIRTLSDLKYLYTATKNANGDLIYHVDGLPYSDPDFRNVGDLIEPEFQEPLLCALENEVVMPEAILSTAWGHVFVSYFPIHNDEGTVVAALGLEFSADSQYYAYQNISLVVNIVMALICILSGLVARVLFQRISNPYFKDIYNTDSLTKLKNRNAYDTDIYNAIQKHELNGACLVITDINGLKIVNDSMGHKMGDFYISACAKALFIDDMDFCVIYRIGGDEFATIIPSKYAKNVDAYIIKVKEKLTELCKDSIPVGSLSMGYAICKEASFDAWEDVQKAADESMYVDKKAYYKTNKALDGRK